MFFFDVMGLWVIGAICWRQHTFALEEKRARSAYTVKERAQRAWSVCRTSVFLSRLRVGNCTDPCAEGQHEMGQDFAARWEAVAEARRERKEYLRRDRFQLGAVLTRALGPPL